MENDHMFIDATEKAVWEDRCKYYSKKLRIFWLLEIILLLRKMLI